MRKAVMILLALLAIRLLPRALRREARALELITLLLELTAAAVANTSKAVSTEQRTSSMEFRAGGLEQGNIPNLQPGSTVGQIQSGLNGRINGLSGAQTTQNGLSNSNVSGTTDLCNGSGGGTGTTSGPSSGTNHTHQYQHSHTAGSLGLVPGGGLHVHNLPTV